MGFRRISGSGLDYSCGRVTMLPVMRITSDPHRETPEDQDFLRQLPDDMTGACLQVQGFVRNAVLSGNTVYGFDMVGEIKRALGLGDVHDEAGTGVILNALEEAKRLTGFQSPETVFVLLARRKKELLNASSVE